MRGTQKTRDWKKQDHIARVEIAGLENVGPNRRGGKRGTASMEREMFTYA